MAVPAIAPRYRSIEMVADARPLCSAGTDVSATACDGPNDNPRPTPTSSMRAPIVNATAFRDSWIIAATPAAPTTPPAMTTARAPSDSTNQPPTGETMAIVAVMATIAKPRLESVAPRDPNMNGTRISSEYIA